MQVSVGADGGGRIKEVRCTFRDSPEETEIWYGTFSYNGDLLTFNGTEVETESSGLVAQWYPLPLFFGSRFL